MATVGRLIRGTLGACRRGYPLLGAARHLPERGSPFCSSRRTCSHAARRTARWVLSTLRELQGTRVGIARAGSADQQVVEWALETVGAGARRLTMKR
jgi:hypothetical protein